MGLRDRLRARQRPTTTYPLRVADTSEAERELRESQVAYRRIARHGGEDDPAVRTAKERLDAAQAAFDACFEMITLVALAPADLEALLAAHPPKGDGDGLFNPDTYPRELFLACVEGHNGDMTREDWEHVLDESCSYGERQELYVLVQALNTRGPSSAIPKGWTPTRD